ncbi:MAG: WYL domain-containing protein [Bacteroidetes bacterium]|nr:WYL domain-containing protein [Bacteroidota bacterium]
MELYGLEIICKDGYYKYSDPNASITNSPLSSEDAEKLQGALSILKQFEGLPQFKDIEEIIIKLDQKASIKGQARPSVVDFERVEQLTGLEYLSQIYESIIQEKALVVDYKPYSEPKVRMVFSAYLLKEYNNRWFVFGVQSEDSKMRTLAIDRIIEIECSTEKYIDNTSFKAAEFFRDIIGVTRMEGISKIDLHFQLSKPRAQYVKSKPLHDSQVVLKDSKSSITFMISVIPNNELMSMLLSYGNDLKVIKPIEYKNAMREAHRKALDLYN